MENMVLTVRNPDPKFWLDKRVLITGHTGFKGGWLSIWLQELGAKVYGLSLPPPVGNSMYAAASVSSGIQSNLGDIRHRDTVKEVVLKCLPEVVFHMAAQPLVRASYRDPVETYATNVMGTVNILEELLNVNSIKSVVNVTTDKCYENSEWIWGYRENEPMGGHDPYSSSKGCSELVTSAYRKSFYEIKNIGLASGRAGNVIGGGDWSADRLIPDILRAFEISESITIRNPNAVRPWQHVLEPISGYLILAENLYQNPKQYGSGFNFGPLDEDAKPVSWIVDYLIKNREGVVGWQQDHINHPHEANYLKLDISKAAALLDWRPRWSISKALQATLDWHSQWLLGREMRDVSLSQIREFTEGSDR